MLPERGSALLFDRSPAWFWGGESVEVDTLAGPMTLPLRDHGPRQLLLFGELRTEREEAALMVALAPRLGNVLDIGANVGWYSCLLARTGLRAGGRVLAIDPNPAVREFLTANAGRYPEVEVLHEAVADSTGETSFYSAPSSDLSSATRRVGTETAVRCTTVDDLVASRLGSVDLVKCDAEGGEMAVLRGARWVRAGANPPIWMIEVNEHFLKEIGSDYHELEAELASAGEPLIKFALCSGGRWVRLAHCADLRSRPHVNVLLVPVSRLPLVQGLLPTTVHLTKTSR
jgi:FkbM family methyltransferase